MLKTSRGGGGGKTLTYLLAGVFAALAVSGAWAGTESNWKDTSVGGSEESPYDISDAANWSNGVGGGHHLNLSVSSLTYITNTASSTVRLADDFRVNSGDFVFLGPIYCYMWVNNTANARVSVLKKGDWRVYDYGLNIGKAAGTTVAFTNETGNVDIAGTRNTACLYIARGEGSTAEVVKESGNWPVARTAFIGSGKNSTARFYNRGGFLTAAQYGVCLGENASGTTGSAYLEISGGAITNTAGHLSIGDGNSGGTAEVRVNGGEYCAQAGSVIVGSRGQGTLTIDSGRVMAPAGGVKFCNAANCVAGRDCFLNLNGGMLETKPITYGSGSANATFTFNGGTLKALQAGTLIASHNNLTVTVDAGGGTIDSGNYAITIAEDLGGTGAMTFSGGNTITLDGAISYTGGTTVKAGTVVVVPDVAARTKLGAITVTGLANSVCEVVRLSGAGSFSAGDLPADTADTTFRVSPDGKSIFAVNGMEGAFWIGGNGDLGTASNWSNGAVPNGSPATISWMSPITLTNSGTFAPSSITFDGSASVTIDGDDITSVVAVTNLSSVSHTINAKVYFTGDIQVKQAAMAGAGDLTKAHVTFAGGAYAASGCSLENGNFDTIYSRCIFGKYYLASTAENPWTVYITTGNRNALAPDSLLYIPYAGDMRELYIASGAKVDIGNVTMLAAGSFSLQNYGEMVVTNVTMTGTGNRHMSYRQGTGTPGMFKFNSVTNEMSSNWFYFADSNRAGKHVFYIGEGGLNYAHGKAIYCLGRDNDGNHETVRPWYSDFTIADRGNSGGALAIRQKVEFCTDDENDVGCKITIDAITMADYTPAIIVSGKGTLQVNNGNVNIQQPPITVKDSATLAFGANGSLGTGDITLGAGTTLALTATSSRSETLIANTLNLPTGEEGAARIRIDGKRLRSGDNVIAAVGTAATSANVALDANSSALAGRKATLRVDGGNLILNIEPNGTLIIIR